VDSVQVYIFLNFYKPNSGDYWMQNSRNQGMFRADYHSFRYSAIMKGAVLYKLGLDFVKDRVLRVSYGTSTCIPFEEGYHPDSRKVMDYDGIARCRGVMHWFAKKVCYLSRFG
jgi:hypothetical protein